MKSDSMRFLAIRMLAGRKDPQGKKDLARRALLGAVASVAISLIPLITVTQIADGMIRGITDRYIELGTYHAQIHVYGARSLDSLRDEIVAVPGIRGAWVETRTVGLVFNETGKEGAAIRGVEPGFFEDPGTAQYLSLISGITRPERFNDAWVGTAIADKLQLNIGDTINLATVRRSLDAEFLPAVNIFRVAGIVSAGYRELDSQWVFIRNDTARRLFQAENTRSFIGIKMDTVPGPQSAIFALLSDLLPPGQNLYSWQTLERNLFESLASTRTMLLLIMAVTVLVAAINVSSALMTLVLERRQEIAVLKGLGAGPGDLALVFSLGGAALGAVGACFGVLGGLLTSLRINELLHAIERVANNLRMLLQRDRVSAGESIRILDPGYYLETIPVEIAFRDIAIVTGLTILVSFFAALVPARKAAKLSPAELFRKH